MFHPVDDFGVNGLTHGDLWIYPGAKFQMDPDPGKLGKAWAWVVWCHEGGPMGTYAVLDDQVLRS